MLLKPYLATSFSVARGGLSPNKASRPVLVGQAQSSKCKGDATRTGSRGEQSSQKKAELTGDNVTTGSLQDRKGPETH